jgi:transcription elongation factor Elf1
MIHMKKHNFNLDICPMCGGEATLHTWVFNGYSYANIRCANCDLTTRNRTDNKGDGSYIFKAVEDWNTRYVPPVDTDDTNTDDVEAPDSGNSETIEPEVTEPETTEPETDGSEESAGTDETEEVTE